MGRTSSKTWRHIVATVREVGRDADLPCGICHGARGPIDYRTAAEAHRDARTHGEWWLIGQYRPLALSVDHIIPYSAGGTDSLDNVIQVHNVCNSTAGAKGHNRQARNTPKQPVTGHWKPADGNGEPLPGKAIPGTRQGSYVFTADPGGGPPRQESSVGPLGIAHTPRGSQTPRSTQ